MPAAKKTEPVCLLHQLPFVDASNYRVRGKPAGFKRVHFWRPPPALWPAEGNEWQRGERFATKMLRAMLETDFPPFLGLVVESMIERGEFGDTEVGFFHEISCLAMRQLAEDEG